MGRRGEGWGWAGRLACPPELLPRQWLGEVTSPHGSRLPAPGPRAGVAHAPTLTACAPCARPAAPWRRPKLTRASAVSTLSQAETAVAALTDNACATVAQRDDAFKDLFSKREMNDPATVLR